MQFQLNAFVLEGATLIQQDELQAALQPWLGRPIRFPDLEQAKQAIVDVYQRYGWFVRPQIPEQDLQDNGELRVELIEGRLGEVRMDGQSLADVDAARLDKDRVVKTLTARQRPGAFLYTPHIERAISLINDTPGMAVGATLAAGQQAGATDVVLSPTVRELFFASLTLDNSGSRATGLEKLTGTLSLNNPAGLGDQTVLNLMRSQGVDYKRLSYSLPLGYDGWRLGVNATDMAYRIITPGVGDTRGTSDTHGLNLSWPALRSSSDNIYFSAAYDRKHFINELDQREMSNKRLGVGNLGFNGDHKDSWGQGGVTQWGLTWSRGLLDLSANTQNQAQDQQGPNAQGRFEKHNVSFSRLQRLSGDNSLLLSLQGQRTNKNLDSSEKLTLGGAQGVRAYPTAEASGDSGWLLALEARRVISSEWQWLVFYDHGKVRVNRNSYPAANGPSHLALKGWGSGLTWTMPGRAVARLTWARRTGGNPLANGTTGMDSDGTLVIHRFWLSLSAFL